MAGCFFIAALFLTWFRTSAAATSLTGKKDIVTYVVTLDSVFPPYLAQSTGFSATVKFTIKPSNRAKFSPKSITIYAENSATIFSFPIDINSYSGPGTYTTTLYEGVDLPVASEYAVKVVVDEDTTDVLPLTVWHVVSLTKATAPHDRNRQSLGVGEEVDLVVGPPTIDPEVINWSAAVGRLSGDKVLNVTYSAVQSPGVVTVSASLGTSEIGLVFHVLAPSSISFDSARNPSDFPLATLGPPNNQIGAATQYHVVVNPISVNFYNARLRENLPTYTFIWPNGDHASEFGTVLPYSVASIAEVNADPSRLNTVGDRHSTGLNSIDVISGVGAGENFSPSAYHFREEYLDGNNAWTPWLNTESVVWSFRGSDQAALVNYNSNPGNWQGPWQ